MIRCFIEKYIASCIVINPFVTGIWKRNPMKKIKNNSNNCSLKRIPGLKKKRFPLFLELFLLTLFLYDNLLTELMSNIDSTTFLTVFVYVHV